MKKIIHLSDLHVGYPERSSKFKELINKILKIKSPASDYDKLNLLINRLVFLKEPAINYIIVITGDLVDNANLPNIYQLTNQCINLLKEKGYTVLVIPGNHDYGTGIWGDKKFVSLFKQTFYENTSLTYPKVDVIDGILFIGLDSMAEELDWDDRMFSEGKLGEAQLKRLNIILNNPEYDPHKKVVYLHHHPFDFEFLMQLRDKEALQSVIQNKVDVLLFGHYHDDTNKAKIPFNGKWGIPRAYNAGSSTHKDGNTGFARVIDLEKKPSSDYILDLI
jgi:predicted MPP superfamily phosphohydrolase